MQFNPYGDANMHGQEFEKAVGPYLLKCRPQPTHEGTFLAHVWIHKADRQGVTEESFTPDLPAFKDEKSAAEAGLAAVKAHLGLPV
jgi:hypothetical protein